jgi:hypothetical protein
MMASCYWAHRLRNLKLNIGNPGGNALRVLRQGLGCNTKADEEFVKISC